MDTEMKERFDNAPTLYWIEKNNKGISEAEILDMDNMEGIRESKFNTYFTVVYHGIDAEDFIEKVVVHDCFLGLNKGQYMNLYYEYGDYKKLYEE